MNLKSRHFNTTISGRPNAVNVDGDIHFALKIWKKQLKDNLIIQDCYERKFFQKPSRIKRQRNNLAKYIQQKDSERNA